MIFFAILGWSPAGHQTWSAGGRGSPAASGRCPKSFNSKLKFLRCPVHFHNRPHILHTSFKYRPISDRESSGNRPLYVASQEKCLGPDMGRYPAECLFTHWKVTHRCPIALNRSGPDMLQTSAGHRPARTEHRPGIGRTI